MKSLSLLLVAILACTAVDAKKGDADPTLRITLLGASVINTDGDDMNKSSVKDHDIWKPWTLLKGDTDAYVEFRAHELDRPSHSAAKAVSTVAHNNLTPTWNELFSFGAQKQTATLSYIVRDSKFFGTDTLLADGRIDIGKFYDAEPGFVDVDMGRGQTMRLHVNWQTRKQCPESARHPHHSGTWFFQDESRCVCDRLYFNMHETGACRNYEPWVLTCGRNLKKQEQPARCEDMEVCVDFDHSLLGDKCPAGGALVDCKFFECRGTR